MLTYYAMVENYLDFDFSQHFIMGWLGSVFMETKHYFREQASTTNDSKLEHVHNSDHTKMPATPTVLWHI